MEKTAFKIYSLLLVKNEADIIASSLIDACRWSDKIVVIDNGSTDGTWEKVQSLAKDHPQIIPFLRYEGPFHIGLRAKAFHAFKHELRRGDWWCVRLDADEFYPGDVRRFLAQIPRCYSTVKKESTDYVLTKEDIAELAFTGDFEQDKLLITHALPERRRERRFMRHSPLLVWEPTWRYPHPMGLTSPTAIPVEHYQYRSPKQMEKRFLTRQQAKQDGCGSFKHERGRQWQDYLLTNRQLQERERLHNLPQTFEQGDTLHEGRNTVRLTPDGWVIKRFAVPRFPNNLIYTRLRKSKARRSYEYALRLKGRTPAPIGFLEVKHGGLLRESYYVCEEAKGAVTFKEISHNPDYPERELLLQQVALFAAQLHEEGILHKDFSGGNILFSEGRILLVDLNRMCFNHKVSLREGCHNFSRLYLTADDCRLMARVYAEHRGFDVDKCTQLFISYHHQPS